MVIAQCSQCKRYFRRINASVRVGTVVMFEDGAWWLASEDAVSIWGRVEKWHELKLDMNCPECEAHEKNTLTLLDVDKCPHQWREGWRSTVRKCELCGIEEKGKVVW